MMPGRTASRHASAYAKSDVPPWSFSRRATRSPIRCSVSRLAPMTIVKPFKPRELVARVPTRIRRSKDRTVAKSSAFRLRWIAHRHDAPCRDSLRRGAQLTPPRSSGFFRCWHAMPASPSRSRTYSRRYGTEPYNSFDSNTVMVHIRRIRKKLSQVDSSREFIKTVFGGRIQARSRSRESRHG